MQHVDDGTIHAWLDDQITDPVAAAALEEHLAVCPACSARVSEERSMHARAHALLGTVAPESERPPFGELLTKMAIAAPDPDTQPRAGAATRRSAVLQAAWAASLVLAIGVGWMARDYAGEQPDPNAVAEAPMLSRTAPTAADPPPPPAVGVSAPPGGRLANAPAVPQAARKLERPEPSADRVAPQLPEQAGPAPRQERPAGVPESELAVADAAPLPPQSFEASAAAPPAPPQPRNGVTGPLTVTGAAAAMEATEWRTIPRTEAAARSGMPLYGIDGLQPLMTTVSPDGRVVRTIYLLESGGSVELHQQRATSEVPSPAGDPQATRRALTPQRGGVVADLRTPTARTWSGLRGDVQVTLRTTSNIADLDALGTRLRVD